MRQKLSGEVLRDVPDEGVLPHAAAGAVFQVSGLPLVDVGAALATDDSEAVARWLDEGRLVRPSEETQGRWRADDVRLAVLIVQPFVLIQEEAVKEGGVERIHWGVVGGDEGTVITAIWPGPVDHDACFQAAGFSSFRDSDDQWDQEFEEIARELVSALMEHGSSEPGSSTDVDSRVDSLVEASRFDYVPEVSLRFGEELELRVGAGHPIFWLRDQGSEIHYESLIRRVARGRRVDETRLDWRELGPPRDWLQGDP